jgi:cell division protein FtsA
MFDEGAPFYTAVLPVGGNNVTNDIVFGLKTSVPVAEQLKVQHATVDLRDIDPEEEIGVSVMGEDAGRTVNRYEVCQIAEARMREIFELIGAELRTAGSGMLPAGIILTGGAAQMPGLAELGRDVLQIPVRVAGPLGVAGLTDTITTPAFSTAIGLLRWGALNVVGAEPVRYDMAPAGGIVGRVRDAIRGFFP